MHDQRGQEAPRRRRKRSRAAEQSARKGVVWREVAIVGAGIAGVFALAFVIDLVVGPPKAPDRGGSWKRPLWALRDRLEMDHRLLMRDEAPDWLLLVPQCEELARRARAEGDDAYLADALFRHGRYLHDAGGEARHIEARPLFAEAAALDEAAGRLDDAGIACHMLGRCLMPSAADGSWDEASRAFERAVGLLRQGSERAWRAQSLLEWARCGCAGDFERLDAKGRRLLEEAQRVLKPDAADPAPELDELREVIEEILEG